MVDAISLAEPARDDWAALFIDAVRFPHQAVTHTRSWTADGRTTQTRTFPPISRTT